MAIETCGSCLAGIVLMRVVGEQDLVERCDECSLFETDADASAAVQELLKILHEEYLAGGATVADAFDRIRDVVTTSRRR